MTADGVDRYDDMTLDELQDELGETSLLDLYTAPEVDGVDVPYKEGEVDPDRYLQRVIEIQFDEEYGAPFWREMYEEELDFDPREEIESFEDLDKLPEADESEIKQRSVDEFIPRMFYGEDGPEPELFDLSKSSGTTGRKKIMPWRRSLSEESVDWYTHNLEERDTGEGDWLIAGPYGLYEKHLEGAANEQGGFAYFSGLETREMKSQLRDFGQLLDSPASFTRDAGLSLPSKLWSAFKGGLRDQRIFQVLGEDLQSEEVANMATHPTIAERLYDVLESEETASGPDDIETILVSGAAIDEGTITGLEEMYENAEIVPMYATSFTGPAFDDPDAETIEYHPLAPFVTFDVREMDDEVPYDEREPVAEGERGQVVINRVAEDFFWPNQTERETAERRESERFDSTGVSDIRPL